MTTDFTHTFCDVLINLLPYWTKTIIESLKLGNEYSMGLNLILTQLIKFIELYLNDKTLICLIVCGGILFISLMYWYNNAWRYISYLNKKSVYFMGIYEITKDNQITVHFNHELIQLNNYIIYKYKINNILHVDNMVEPHSIIYEITDLKLETDLYLSVTHKPMMNNNNNIIVNYKISSYHKNMQDIIATFIREYNKIKQDIFENHIVLYGNENNGLNYPDHIITLIEYMVEKHKYKFLRYSISINPNSTNNNSDDDKKKIIKVETNQNNNKKEITFTLDDMVNFQIEPDILLNVSRTGTIVRFKLTTKNKDINLYDYLQELRKTYNKYITTKMEPHVNKITINISKSTFTNSIEKFTSIGLAINYTLVKKYNIKQFKIIDVDNSDIWDRNTSKNDTTNIKINYMIGNMVQYNLCDDIYITVVQDNTTMSSTNSEYTVYNCIFTNCIIESDITPLDDFVNDCKTFYIENNKSKDNFTYHFIYNGLDKDNDCVFTTNILYDYQDNPKPISINIYNEHTAYIQKNIDKLRNMAYYQTNGLKRKLGYLFYGEPGTGKTVMVSTMAIYDKRHILEIPFSVLKTREEFIKLMNIDEINGVNIKKSQLIVLFDEIDIGIQHFGREHLNVDDTDDKAQQIVFVDINMSKKTGITDSKIQLDTILSQLDGVTNYDGLIIIATTNNKDKLDPALCRELRLTPLEFCQLRKEDVRLIIERFYGGVSMSEEQYSKIKDRHYYPSKLVYLCDKYVDEKPIDEFVDYITSL